MNPSEACGYFLLFCVFFTVVPGFLTGLRHGLLVLAAWAFLFAWAAAEASRKSANQPPATEALKNQ